MTNDSTVPEVPSGSARHPVVTPAGATLGTRVHVWSAAIGHDAGFGMPIRERLGTGRLIGWLHRERTYSGDVAHFEIGGDCREAVASDDVALPIVETIEPAGATPRYLPSYPHCPECGGRIARNEAGREPGSRKCDGVEDCPGCDGSGEHQAQPCEVCSGSGSWREGCGSTFVDTRYGVAMAVPAAEDSP